MKIGDGQQVRLAVRQPLRFRERLTLHAVTIATRVVGNPLMRTSITGFDVPT
jgi:hypothetical protein